MIDASLVHISPLRGRSSEGATLRDVVASARSGQGRAVLLCGEIGTGKSLLLRHAAEAAHDALLLTTAGVPSESGLAYGALHRLLAPVADLADRLPPQHTTILRRLLDGALGPGEAGLPLVAAVLELLTRAGGASGVLCTVDDAHRLDRPSAQTLAAVARRLAGRRIAVVLAACPQGDTAGFLAGIPTLSLTALSPEACRQILADRLPGGLPEATIGALLDTAMGNPLALVELAAATDPADPDPSVRLPADSLLRRACRDRLSGLSAETRRLLLFAAADPQLRAAELAAAARSDGLDVGALTPAETAGLVRAGESGFTFPQPLVRTIVYEEAPLAQRRAAHRLLARSLTGEANRLRRAVHLAASTYGPDPRLAAELESAARRGGCAAASVALKRAAELSADPASAAKRLVTAAGYAWRSGHPGDARTLLGQAASTRVDGVVQAQSRLLIGEMELRSGAAADALRSLLAAADAFGPAHRDLALAALMRAGEAVSFAGGHYRYASIERRARALGVPQPSALQELMLAHLTGAAALFRGDHEVGVQRLRRAAELAEAVPDAATLTWGSSACLLIADDARALRLAERAVTGADVAGDRSVLPRALELKAIAECNLGRFAAAEQTSRTGLSAARASGQDNCAGNHLGLLGVLAALRGDRAGSLRWVGAVPAGGERDQVDRPAALSQWALGMLDLHAMRPAEAVARFAAIAQPWSGRGHLVVYIMAAPYLVEAAVRAGDRSTAQRVLRLYDSWAAGLRDPGRRALAARCHGLVAARGSADALEHFRTALRRHAEAESGFERARTQLLLGQELRRARQPRQAREHLRMALEVFQQLDAASWVEQTAAELRAAGGPATVPRRAPAEPEGMPAGEPLTAQQAQIARLVVQGATNREVAAQLFLSTRTVDHHMRNIFAKLGIRSRMELARLFTADAVAGRSAH